MMQAVKDLREIYGQEVDSDENVVNPRGPFAENDSDSEGEKVLEK